MLHNEKPLLVRMHIIVTGLGDTQSSIGKLNGQECTDVSPQDAVHTLGRDAEAHGVEIEVANRRQQSRTMTRSPYALLMARS